MLFFRNLISQMFLGYLTILTARVMSAEFSECYNDVNICLWTNDSKLTQSEAQTACQQRNSSSLPRITNSNLQDKLGLFRVNSNLLGTVGFWINVKRVDTDRFHWIDGSPLKGHLSSCFRLLQTTNSVKHHSELTEK